ncbi:MAG: PPOX class F420-dependent oxidoreductase [Acidimicrobiia bacterium]
MAHDPAALSPELTEFLRERHLASLTTVRADGSLHVCAVGFTWDPEARLARVITSAGSQKARNVQATGRAAVGQVDGPRWCSLEGPARVVDDADAVGEAVDRYRARYREPRENPKRVAIEISVERVLGRA